MSLHVAAVAEGHQIAPHEPQGRVFSDRHNVVDLAGRGCPAPLLAVLAQWMDGPVPLRQHIPLVVVVIV